MAGKYFISPAILLYFKKAIIYIAIHLTKHSP